MTEAAIIPNSPGERNKLNKKKTVSQIRHREKENKLTRKVLENYTQGFGDKKEWNKNLSGKLDEIRKEITEVSIEGRQNWAHEITKQG